MKLKSFNTDNVRVIKTGTPTIQVNGKAGLFFINGALCDLAGIKIGSQVIFHQDEDDEINWYMEVVKEKGFAVRAKESSSGVSFNNSAMARRLIGDNKKGKFLIAGKPTSFEGRKLWGLLNKPS